jgi:hypothetical protein
MLRVAYADCYLCMLSVTYKPLMLSVVMLNVIVFSVIMLNVIVLSVVEPLIPMFLLIDQRGYYVVK